MPLQQDFQTQALPAQTDVIAPDGSAVRVLLALKGGSTIHIELAPGIVSRAVCHTTVEEIWFFLSGRGEMWRKNMSKEETVTVETGVCVTIPVGTSFQFRTTGDEPLKAFAVTMPPWPGEGEATIVDGIW